MRFGRTNNSRQIIVCFSFSHHICIFPSAVDIALAQYSISIGLNRSLFISQLNYDDFDWKF